MSHTLGAHGLSSLHTSLPALRPVERSADDRPPCLLLRSVGVHVGIEHVDWQLLQLLSTSATGLQRDSVYAASGEQLHVASGRQAAELCATASAET